MTKVVKKNKRVLVLCPSPEGTAATQRLKYEQYLGLLKEQGYNFTISSFQTQRFWEIIYINLVAQLKKFSGHWSATCDVVSTCCVLHFTMQSL